MNESNLPPAGPSTSGIPKNHRMWAMFSHLAALAGYFAPFGNLVGPLIVWLIKKEEMPFLDDQGKESLNFQITMTLAMVLSGLLVLVVVGLFLLPVVALLNLVLILVAAVKANDGIPYRYPLCIRFIR